MGMYGNLQVTLKVGGCAGAPWLRGCDSRFSNGVGIRSGRDYHQEQGTLELVTFLISKGKNKWEVLRIQCWKLRSEWEMNPLVVGGQDPKFAGQLNRFSSLCVNSPVSLSSRL